MSIIAKSERRPEDFYKFVLVECPKCRSRENLKIPNQIINQSKQLTTASVPSGLVCEHSFQAFIDKNFKVRGYQNVDFEIAKMEYYEDFSKPLKQEKNYAIEKQDNLLPFLQKVVKLLRDCLNDELILGCAIFTIEGRILYSSLTVDTLYNIIKEFEVRNEKKLILVKKLFLVLEDNEKICSEFMEIRDEKLIVVLAFSETVKLGMSNCYLSGLIKKIIKLEQKQN